MSSCSDWSKGWRREPTKPPAPPHLLRYLLGTFGVSWPQCGLILLHTMPLIKQPGEYFPQLFSPVFLLWLSVLIASSSILFYPHPFMVVGPLTHQSSLEGSWQHCDVEEHCKGGWGQWSYGWTSSQSQETMSRDAPLDTKISIGEFISGFKQSSPSYRREFNPTLY